MREIIYKYKTQYITEDNTGFGEDTKLKLIVEPHEFSIAVGGEVLRKSSFTGCSVEVTNEGAAAFYDNNGNLIGKAEKGENIYEKIALLWKNEQSVSVQFGHIETVDNYPNCDGEHDRWDERWVAQRSVLLSLKDNSLSIQ